MGCGKAPETKIIGYWMRGDGYTISFTDETYCSFGDEAPREYKIYDEKHLQVIDENEVREFVFELEGDTLWLGLVEGIEPTIEFTRDEEKQKEILAECVAIANEENERTSLEKKKDSIQQQIDKAKKDIQSNNNSIVSKKSSIEYYEGLIESYYDLCESAIELGNDRTEEEKGRDELIEQANKEISKYKNQISELESENKGLEEEIKKLEKDKAEVEKLLSN